MVDIKILENEENPLLNRKEIKAVAEAEKNPSYEEASKLIAENFKADKESIAIKLIKGKFGRDTFLISANIYNTKEDKEKIEPKKKERKQAGQQEVEKSAEKKQKK